MKGVSNPVVALLAVNDIPVAVRALVCRCLPPGCFDAVRSTRHCWRECLAPYLRRTNVRIGKKNRSTCQRCFSIVSGADIRVKGPRGTFFQGELTDVTLTVGDNVVTYTRGNQARAQASGALSRTMVELVTVLRGFKKTLEIPGCGFVLP